MSTRGFSILLIVLSTELVLGCIQSQPGTSDTASSAPSDHTSEQLADPHDIPLTDAETNQLRHDTATWSAAIQHVQTYRDAIRMETTTGEPAKAQRPLDLLGLLLQWLPEIAQNNHVPKVEWQSIGENSKILRDLLDKLHMNIDDGKAPDFESIAAEIDGAIEALAAIKVGGFGGTDSQE